MILCCSSHPSGFSSSTGAFANRKGRAVAAATAPKFAGSAGVKRAPRAVMPLGFRYRRHRARQRVEGRGAGRSEEHTSELQSLMRISYAVFCLKKKTTKRICATREIEKTTKLSIREYLERINIQN